MSICIYTRSRWQQTSYLKCTQKEAGLSIAWLSTQVPPLHRSGYAYYHIVKTLLLNLMQRTYVDQLYFLALEKAEAGAQILQLLCLDKRPFMVDAESLGTGDTLQQLYQNKSVLKVRLQICDLPGGCFLVPAQRSIDVLHKGSLLQQLPVLVHPLRHFGFWRSFQ